MSLQIRLAYIEREIENTLLRLADVRETFEAEHAEHPYSKRLQEMLIMLKGDLTASMRTANKARDAERAMRFGRKPPP
jgi:hypothetical protein